jgi:hypothetical protein
MQHGRFFYVPGRVLAGNQSFVLGVFSAGHRGVPIGNECFASGWR